MLTSPCRTLIIANNLVTLSHFICKISMTLWYVLAAFYKVAAFAFLISGNEYAAEITSICI